MASSVSSLNASAMSSIYGNRNVISGLASGLDTESMIENAVSGIKMKISGLQQDKTKVQWEQEALRSMIDKLVDFNQKFMSYTSDTNLFSPSFFNSAVKVSTVGKFADMISASGKTSSNVEILGVKQIATAAKYNLKGLAGLGASDVPTISAGESVDLEGDYKQSKVSGTLSITYGTRKINLSFDETVYESPEAFKEALQKKLDDVKLTNSEGETVSASSMIKVNQDADGNITFSDAQDAGNKVYISGATGNIKTTLGIDGKKESDTLTLKGAELFSTTKLGEYLTDKELTITLDGVTKTIKFPGSTANMYATDVVNNLQSQLNDAFGKGKITIDTSSISGSQFTFKLTASEDKKGSIMTVSGSAAKALGLGSTTATSYLDTGKTLGDLLGDKWDESMSGMVPAAAGDITAIKNAEGKITGYVDSEGNSVAEKKGKYYRVDDKGDFLYEFKLNGKTIGNYSKNTALETIMVDINNSEAGVSVTYSKTTNQFQFTATETGLAGKIEFDGDLAEKLFGTGKDNSAIGADATEGRDAILTMKVNDQVYNNVSRSSNTFDVDGLTINLKGPFGYTEAGELDPNPEAVTFNSTTDADKIVDAVKSFVEDYNTMITEIKNAYSTMPAEKTDGSRYEPLTSEDAEGMSESEIKAYEEKAKQGILFADRDISNLYEDLNSAINPGGADASFLRSIGIDTAYSDGLTTLKLDEDKLRAALESNPDGVKDAFTKTVENGASTDGIMKNLQTAVDRYAKVTGSKGILVERAGSVKAPATLNDNTLQDKLDDYEEQIEKWNTQLSNQIDYYSSQFTRLEQLILQMNSQSSTLMGLMGGSQ